MNQQTKTFAEFRKLVMLATKAIAPGDFSSARWKFTQLYPDGIKVIVGQGTVLVKEGHTALAVILKDILKKGEWDVE